MQSDGQTEPIPTADDIRADYRALQAREFWERVYIAALESEQFSQAQYSKIANDALQSWRERFEPKLGE